MLPRRAGDEVSGALVVQGYRMMLGHLSDDQVDTLTRMVLEECKWFPTVAECRQLMARESYSNPFYVAARQKDLGSLGYHPQPAPKRLTAPAAQAAITDRTKL